MKDSLDARRVSKLWNGDSPASAKGTAVPSDSADHAAASMPDDFVPPKSSRAGALAFGVAVFLATCAVVALVSWLAFGAITLATFVAMAVLGLLAVSSVHIALNWERVVILRLGKANRVAGPGLYFTIPLIEFQTIRVDQRTVVTPFSAYKTLTADLVPVNIDAVLYWVVRDPLQACLEVEDYYEAVSYLAQTAMREAVGRSTVSEVAVRRDQLDSEIEADISRESADWGVDIIAVKVRDIVLPDELQEAMSLEAQAEREKSARMTVASAEEEMAEMLAEAGKIYGDESAAFKLRAMLMQYDTVKRSKGTVVTVPTSLSDGFVDPSKDAGRE